MREEYLGLLVYDLNFVFGYFIELNEEVTESIISCFMYNKKYMNELKRLFGIIEHENSFMFNIKNEELDKVYKNFNKLCFNTKPNAMDKVSNEDKKIILDIACEYKKYIDMLEEYDNTKEGMKLWKS